MKLHTSPTRPRRAEATNERRPRHAERGGSPGGRRSDGADHGAMNHAIRCREADEEIRDLLSRY